MLVSGAGQIKLTKDGNILLHEMQIQHPTAVLIARAATATDDSVGDGTTTTVLFTGELMNRAERQLSEGLHPRIIVDGFELAKDKVLEILDEFKEDLPEIENDREILCDVARTALGTKLRPELVGGLTEIITDAVLTIRRPSREIDLHMVEIMHMQHRFDTDSRLVKGLVLDHGARHPDMPKKLENAFILTLNVSLEFEKSEVSAGFFYKDAEVREKMVSAERKFTDDKVKQIIDFKREVCTPENGKSFVIISQKGIDPLSLDMFAKEGILALRRAKRRNMERLTLACGGSPVHSVEDLTEDVLGFAERVHEVVLGEEKYTFVEGVSNPYSCTVLVKGQNPHTIAQIKDSIRDGLRAVKNAIEDKSVVAGAGSFEIHAHRKLVEYANSKAFTHSTERKVSRKSKLGVIAFAEALLIVPRTLAANSGFDVQDTLIHLQQSAVKDGNVGKAVGLDVVTGEAILPGELGIWDSFRVKRSVIHLSTVLASQLLLVDEMVRGGRGSRPKDPNMPEM